MRHHPVARFILTTILGAAAVLAGSNSEASSGAPQAEEAKPSRVLVQAYRDDTFNAPVRSYRIASVDLSWACEELDESELRELVRRALSAHGMFEAPPELEADLSITISAAKYSRSRPKLRRFIAYRRILEREVQAFRLVQDESGTVTKQRETITIPMPQERSPETRPIEVVRWYEKQIFISARLGSGDENKRGIEVWRAEASTKDGNENMRPTLPVLVSALLDHIGTKTSGREEILLSKSDERVLFVTSNW